MKLNRFLCSSQEQTRFSPIISKTSNQKYLWSEKQIGTCLCCVLPIHLVDSAKHSKACAANSETCLLYSVYHGFFLVDTPSEAVACMAKLSILQRWFLSIVKELSSIKGSVDALHWLKGKSFHFGWETWRLYNLEVYKMIPCSGHKQCF